MSVANLTILDDPAGDVEHHWIWSVIGHPSVQLALTDPPSDVGDSDYVEIDWAALLGLTGSIDTSIVYKDPPKYSAAIMLANVSFQF